MARTVEVGGIGISAKTAKCAHACRYCLMGRKSASGITAERFVRLVDRFIEWRGSRADETFQIWQAMNYSYNISLEDQARLLSLHDRLNWKPLTRRVHLGGLPMWGEAEATDWLRARRDIGILSVHASLAGHGKVHDYWNGRKGDFDYLLMLLGIAAKLGLGLRQRLFVVKSTMPILEEAMARLDVAGAPLERYFLPFFYRGTAMRYEKERISKSDFERLPQAIKAGSGWGHDQWQSEREWIDRYRDEAASADRVVLHLEVTDANIDEIERLSCDDILKRIKARTVAAYEALPTRLELLERWSDPSSDLIYPNGPDVERVWLDRYLRDNPVAFDRNLTHLTTMH